MASGQTDRKHFRMKLVRALPLGVFYMLVSAVSFLVTGAALALKGQTQLTEVSLVQGVLAVAIAVAFGDWPGPRSRRF